MLDLEISTWECLEEQSNEPAMGRLADEASRAVNSDGYGESEEEEEALAWTGEGEGGNPAREEEQALTAEALNDLFYLMDAQAEAVNALEAAFSMDDAVKDDAVDESETEEDARSENMKKALEDIRKIFDVSDIPEEDIPDEFKPPDMK